MALIRTDVSEERIASIIRIMEAIRFSETSLLRRAMQLHIPEDDILLLPLTPTSLTRELDEYRK
jgi:hypothetical protein